ncbi:CocE/NonD family hydrolase [Panacagrimonas sp.]|uniref:CocE/NonD family hydrolase n=1 Tax=Panacagrimonas sp. TaxID=2480088 RepID=UPI003B520F80
MDSRFTRAITVFAVMTLVLLGGCGGSSSVDSPPPPPGASDGVGNGAGNPVAACDAALAFMPTSPAQGQARTGLVCEINIPSPLNPADKIAFQVFEPLTLVGGQTYPLVLEGHGFSASRQTNDRGPGIPGLSAPIGALREAGYGIVSIDQAGHGETGGTIRVMDPDQEGRFLLAILDWLETNLDWYAVGPDLDAGEDNMLLGAIGPSYGGGYQYLIQAIDPKKRLDAIVPQITWNDLTYSLNPGGVIKILWTSLLFLTGQQAGGGGNFDPFVNQTFLTGLANNRIDEFGQDFFRYHGPGYFCDGTAVATNGGPGTAPGFAPVSPTAVHTLMFQGFRDTLFNFNEAWRNYECLKGSGADVRLLTYQAPHNSLQLVPDPIALITQPAGALDFDCGSINADEATVAWFDRYLKGIVGAVDAVLGDNQVCLSLSPRDAVFVDEITAGRAGNQFEVPTTATLAGVALLGAPIPLYTAPAGGAVMAGVPRIEIDLTEAIPGTVPNPEDVIVFVGTGRTRADQQLLWGLADNQVQPLRGLGRHEVDLPGIGERLAEGESAGLLLYGLHEQYVVTGGLNVAAPAIGGVRIQGRALLPLLDP